MLGHRALTLQDYVVILKRRWWILAIPAIIFPIVGYGLSFMVQPQYLSQTLVLVEQQKVPDSYVKAVVTEDLSGRLATMREQILSRSRLQPIIERFNLFANSKMSMDGPHRPDAKEHRHQAHPVGSCANGGIAGVLHLVQGRGCAHGTAGVREITSLFVSENLNDRALRRRVRRTFLRDSSRMPRPSWMSRMRS